MSSSLGGMMLLVLWLFVGLARADEPVAAVASSMPETIAMRWPEGEVRRYFATMAFSSPYVIHVLAVENEERMASELSISTVLRCVSLGVMRSATEVQCQVEDAGIIANPLRSDYQQLQPVLEEWDRSLGASTVHFRVRDDGRVDRVRLEGMPSQNARERYIALRLELFMARVLSPLDLELPGEPATDWWHRSPAVGNIPFQTTGGSLRIRQRVASSDGVWTVSGHGEGSLIGQHNFSMVATTEHVINPDCSCIIKGSALVSGAANVQTGTLGYRMVARIEYIGDLSLDAPLQTRDMSL